MKKAFFVDTTLVTTPSADESKEAVEAWLKMLQMWLQEALYGHFQWLHCVQASNLLTEHMRFPSFIGAFQARRTLSNLPMSLKSTIPKKSINFPPISAPYRAG